MRRFRAFRLSAAALVASASAARADSGSPTIDLKPGQEVTFAVEVAGGRVALGPGRVSKLGTVEPNPGEITVGVQPKVKPFYAEVRTRERTAAPVDFVATGLIGGTKIDEVIVCGRLDAPVSTRIANAAWVVSLRDFEPGAGDASCR